MYIGGGFLQMRVKDVVVWGQDVIPSQLQMDDAAGYTSATEALPGPSIALFFEDHTERMSYRSWSLWMFIRGEAKNEHHRLQSDKKAYRQRSSRHRIAHVRESHEWVYIASVFVAESSRAALHINRLDRANEIGGDTATCSSNTQISLQFPPALNGRGWIFPLCLLFPFLPSRRMRSCPTSHAAVVEVFGRALRGIDEGRLEVVRKWEWQTRMKYSTSPSLSSDSRQPPSPFQHDQ